MVPPASHRISRVPRYSGTCSLSSPSLTGLSPSSVRISTRFRSAIVSSRRPSTPPVRRPTVWPLTSSLATTKVIEFSFFSSGYLDVSLPRVPSGETMDSSHGDCALPQPGSPIRISWDQSLLATPPGFSQLKPTCNSPRLFAAYRVLRRQSVPWHPPCALIRLIL